MIVIGKNRFDVPPPKGMASFALQQSVIPIAGRLAGAIAVALRMPPGENGMPGLSAFMDMNVAEVLPKALPAIGHVFAEMPPGELERITRTLLTDAKCDGVKLFGAGPNGDSDPFDALMAGRTIDTWKLLWHAMEAWYPDFFALVRDLRGQGAQAASDTEA